MFDLAMLKTYSPKEALIVDRESVERKQASFNTFANSHQNAIEAIQARGGADGRVETDFKEIDGVNKLRITDNGIAMTPDEVRGNINRLSASTGIQARQKTLVLVRKLQHFWNGCGSVSHCGCRPRHRYGASSASLTILV